MKFQKIESFEKNVKSSFPNHLSPIYLIVCPKESERKKILSSLSILFDKETDFKKISQIQEGIAHLNSASLFSGKMGALFDGVDQLVKGEVELLSKYCKNPNPKSVLLLGAATSKNVSDLYKQGKKEMVLLDLSSEKPWEEKDRLQKWVIQYVHAYKKKITPSGLQALFERLSPDRLLLQQELDKLLCFLAEREQIEKEDVETLCPFQVEEKPYKMAQELIWNFSGSLPKISDLSLLLPLVGQLRGQLEMGLKIGALMKKGASSDEISAALPKLWPKALQQVLEGTKRKGLPFFKRGISALFDLEFALKSGGKPEIAFSLFCHYLHEHSL